MPKGVLRPTREEIVSPRKFLRRLAEQRSNIVGVRVRPARVSKKKDFGKIVIRYENPILSAEHG